MTKKFEKSDIKNAIKGSGGIVSTIAKRLKCDWNTADKYIKKFGLSDLVKDEKESLLDLAEGMLIKNIQEQDNTAIIFYLKTQGKQRGYTEKQEVDHTTGGDKINSISKDQEKEILTKLKKQMDEFKDYEK